MYVATALLSWASRWTRPVECQLLTSPLMVTPPSTAAVSTGTAIRAASRHRTRQFLRANRDQAEPGRLVRGGVDPAMPTAGPVWGWATSPGV